MPRRRKKNTTPPAPKRRYQDMGLFKNTIALSTMGGAVKTLIEAIYNGDAGASDTYFNHGYDKDPNTNGGSVPGDVKVAIYYFPASEAEIASHETIAGAGVLSGRRRLAARQRAGGYPDYEEIWSFYTTNHPREKPGLRTNAYGVFTPIDPKR
jgi:hypothetical protein